VEGDQLGALFEERIRPERLEVEVVLHRGAERFIRFGAQVLLGERAAEAQLRLVLRQQPWRSGEGQRRGACLEKGAT
jgi:chromosome condensin MukBEF MukE localization factor